MTGGVGTVTGCTAGGGIGCVGTTGLGTTIGVAGADAGCTATMGGGTLAV